MAVAPEVWDALGEQIGPLRLPRAYCPVDPTLKQEWFLRQDAFEAFFGGAAGPGKSWGLLMAALQYVDMPGYHALLLRPTLGEFEQPGGLIDVSHDWLDTTDAWWNGTKRTWAFPSGATVRFGYLANQGDLSQYKGPSYSFCGFDELTSFPYALYRGMFRILRQALGELEGVPLRMRSASNPGDIGHGWVKARFVEPGSRAKRAVYVPAKITDNPYLDYDVYVHTVLAEMAPVDRARLINGDWDVTEEGGKFAREKFQIVPAHQIPPPVRSLRYWDLAGTVPSPSNEDPDYTVGLRYEVDPDGYFTVRHIVRVRLEDGAVQKLVRSTAAADGREVTVFIEKDPGQAGKSQVATYQRLVLPGFSCYGGETRIGGVNAAKDVRASPVAAAVGNDLVRVVEGIENMLEFLDECSIFPNGAHDDCVDALSGAHNSITLRLGGSSRPSLPSVPQGRIPGVIDRRAEQFFPR